MPDATLAGAILAGGQARRLGGRDKSRLLVSDAAGDAPPRTIIVRQVDALQRLTARVVVVTSVSDRQLRPDRFDDLPVDVVVDRIEGAGVLGGIHAALTGCPESRVLVLASDTPYVTPAVLDALADVPDWADGRWVCSARGPEPLLACYRRRALGRLNRMLRDGERRAGALADWLALDVLAGDRLAALGDPVRLMTNINTPEDLRRVQ